MEKSTIWTNDSLPGIELLSASYRTFEFSKHWHDELAIGLIEAGAEGLYYRGNNVVIPENQIVAINPSEIHTGFAATSTGWRYRMFYFDLEMLAKQFSDHDVSLDPIVTRPVIDDPLLFNQLHQLHLSLELTSFDLTKQSLLASALDRLFTHHSTLKSIDSSRAIDMFGAYTARDYIIDNWHENLTLEQLEDVTGKTKFQIIRSFKAQFGVTPHQFMLLVKTRKAKQLLAEGKSCVDISLACGFYDQSHFSRNFKRVFGVTPMNYSPRSP